MTLNELCQPIEVILSDVDGVMTDGGIILDSQGVETKRFHIRDGMGIKLWQKAGYRFGLITMRSSHMVKMRAGELGIDIIRQGIDDKLSAIKRVLDELSVKPRNVCYIGDDLPDLPPMRYIGLAVCVADACRELRENAHYVTTLRGGDGAVRETIEMILDRQRHWHDVIRGYTGE